MTTKLYHIICEWLRDLIEGTPWEGHVFAVGGCCRDEIMGFEIKDLDLAVDLPDGGVKFARWLMKQRLTTGRPIFFLKYGTAKLRLRRFPDDEIELVQTRREQYTKETSRCPEVAFGTIEEDCYRRDFTVNSLYYDITRRRMVDITGLGIKDMHDGLLRTPMDPDETFNDDPVRILRGLRFANRFGWRIDPPVYEALLRHIYRIEIVSRERVHSELCKMLTGPDPIGALKSLKETGALVAMIPDLAPMVNDRTTWEQALQRLETVIGNYADAPTRYRLTALFMSLAPKAATAAKIVRRIMTTLRFDRPIVSDVVYLVRYAEVDDSTIDNWRQVRAMQNLASTPRRFAFLLGFMNALGHREAATALKSASDRLIRQGKGGYNPAKGKEPDAKERGTKGSSRGRRGRNRKRRGRRGAQDASEQ